MNISGGLGLGLVHSLSGSENMLLSDKKKKKKAAVCWNTAAVRGLLHEYGFF